MARSLRSCRRAPVPNSLVRPTPPRVDRQWKSFPMTAQEVRAAVDGLLDRRAIRIADRDAMHRAADLVEAGTSSADAASEVLVFASWYGSDRTRQLTRELYTTLLSWCALLMPDDRFEVQ